MAARVEHLAQPGHADLPRLAEVDAAQQRHVAGRAASPRHGSAGGSADEDGVPGAGEHAERDRGRADDDGCRRRRGRRGGAAPSRGRWCGGCRSRSRGRPSPWPAGTPGARRRPAARTRCPANSRGVGDRVAARPRRPRARRASRIDWHSATSSGTSRSAASAPKANRVDTRQWRVSASASRTGSVDATSSTPGSARPTTRSARPTPVTGRGVVGEQHVDHADPGGAQQQRPGAAPERARGSVSPAAGSRHSSAATTTAGVTRSRLASRTSVTTTIAPSWATGLIRPTAARPATGPEGERMRHRSTARSRSSASDVDQVGVVGDDGDRAAARPAARRAG